MTLIYHRTRQVLDCPPGTVYRFDSPARHGEARQVKQPLPVTNHYLKVAVVRSSLMMGGVVFVSEGIAGLSGQPLQLQHCDFSTMAIWLLSKG